VKRRRSDRGRVGDGEGEEEWWRGKEEEGG